MNDEISQVWKKHPDGVPTLPSTVRKEVEAGLSSISTSNFPTGVRAMLASVNVGDNGGGADDTGWEGAPPASFAVEAVNQVGVAVLVRKRFRRLRFFLKARRRRTSQCLQKRWKEISGKSLPS